MKKSNLQLKLKKFKISNLNLIRGGNGDDDGGGEKSGKPRCPKGGGGGGDTNP